MEILKTMYGLKQSNSISEKHLRDTLVKRGYYYTNETGLYVHPTRKTTLAVHVDDFMPIVYGNHEENAKHLVATLSEVYGKLKVNFCGLDQPNPPTTYSLDFCGLEIEHDTIKQEVHISMKEYYKKLVSHIPADIKPRNTPGKPFTVNYGQTEQHAHDPLSCCNYPRTRSPFTKILWRSHMVFQSRC